LIVPREYASYLITLIWMDCNSNVDSKFPNTVTHAALGRITSEFTTYDPSDIFQRRKIQPRRTQVRIYLILLTLKPFLMDAIRNFKFTLSATTITIILYTSYADFRRRPHAPVSAPATASTCLTNQSLAASASSPSVAPLAFNHIDTRRIAEESKDWRGVT
jgi:hypothetical protein